MSTTSEYYIRNMSMGEFERFHERLQRGERKRTRAELKRQLQEELKRAQASEGKAREAQQRALQAQLKKLTQEGREQAACHKRMMSALEQRLEGMRREGDERSELLERTMSALQSEQAQLERELDELQRDSLALEGEVSAVKAELRRSEEARRVAQEAASGYYQGLSQLYERALKGLSREGCERFELGGALQRLMSVGEQAREQHRLGIESAAASTISQALREAHELEATLNAREDEERALSLALRLLQDGAQRKLQELSAQEVRRYLGAHVERMETRLKALSDEGRALGELSAWRERREAMLAHQAALTSLDEQLSELYHRYDELIEQSAHREGVLKGLVQALVEVWGGSYEMDAYLEDPNDLSSALLFRTKRGPYAPNAQARITIDGRMEASLTGYHGVECAQDEEQLREALSRRSKVEVVRELHQVTPSAPNPSDSGPTPRPTRVEVVQESTPQRPSWLKRGR